MKLRARKYVMLAATFAAATVYSLLAGGWGDVAFYGGAAGVLVLILLIGLPWLEFAPDRAFRRQPRS